jgi:hypothetical protein
MFLKKVSEITLKNALSHNIDDPEVKSIFDKPVDQVTTAENERKKEYLEKLEKKVCIINTL